MHTLYVRIGVVLGVIVLAGCTSTDLLPGSSTEPPASLSTNTANEIPTYTTETTTAERLVCPESVAAKPRSVWTKIGGNPYRGTAKYAIHLVDVPAAVKQQWRQAIKTAGSQEHIPNGTQFCSMMYSTAKKDADGYWHHRWDNVIAQWNDRESALARVWEVKHNGLVYQLIKPLDCDNWSYRVVQRTAEPKAYIPKTETPSDNGLLTFRIRFWQFESFPASLQKSVLEVTPEEGDHTYAFDPGAVSRDYGGEMVECWRDSVCTTIKRAAHARVWISGTYYNGEPVSASPGDHAKYPRLTYWEKKVPESVVLSADDPYFGAAIMPPRGCLVISPPAGPRGRYLAYKQKAEVGENELLRAFRNGEDTFNLNVVISCSELVH